MRTTPARRAASALAAICASLLLLSLFLIPLRYLGVVMGVVPVARATADAEALAPALPAGGGTVRAEYCSEAVTASGLSNLSGRTSTSLAFHDAWLFQAAGSYHHDLATACSVLAAVCNSESQYYSDVEGSVPYAERALWALGFDNVRTESYALRSSLLDELGAFFIGSHDVAAYTFASKTAPDPTDGEPCTLVFVGVRGSYGVEWLSNFNLHGDGSGSNDHHGFETAESEVESALDQYAREVGADPQRTRILITGHSRGGAIANLLAARLDDRSGTSAEIAPASGVYAYTFAAPGSTREADCQNAAYGNVFNIVNEADIVPQLPLSTWGYGRYGTTVSLPSVASGEFEESFDRMCQAFQRNTGVTPACDESSLASLDAFERNAAKALPSADALASPAGIAAAAQTLLGTDLAAALASHAPDAYIAWMQAVDGDALSFDGPAARTTNAG